ncbi:MAG: hypothetical protein Q9218_008211 [Villophora microphyllina]
MEDSHSAQSTMYKIEGGDTVAQGGIVTFNTTVGKWTNSSMPNHLMRTHGRNGILNALPAFGPRGLLLAAGTGIIDGAAPSFENITLYEPGQKTWHYQTATGDISEGSDGVCNVGIPGDNGTYEICEIVGNRQMLPIGGRNPLDDGQGILSPDPKKRGLQIFDLTEMRWIDWYDADAAPYRTPQVVKDWYQKNGTSSVQWDDPKVRDFFQDTGKHSSPTPQPHHTSARAIAGGVVGGLALHSIIIAFLYWFFQRRRRRQARRRNISDSKNDMAYAHDPLDHSYTSELPEDGRIEADGKPLASEADGSPRIELDGRKDIRAPAEML